MPVIAITSAEVSDRGKTWSWHLAWALALRGASTVWIETGRSERSDALVSKSDVWRWNTGKLPSLAILDSTTEPWDHPELPDGPAVVLSTPSRQRRHTNEIDAALAHWAEAQSTTTWTVIDLTPSTYGFGRTLAVADHVIVITEATATSLRSLRNQGPLTSGTVSYTVQQRPSLWASRAHPTAHLSERIPGAFRQGWGGEPSHSDLRTAPAGDQRCIGVVPWPTSSEGSAGLTSDTAVPWWPVVDALAAIVGQSLAAPPETSRAQRYLATSLEKVMRDGFLADSAPQGKEVISIANLPADHCLIIGESGLGKTFLASILGKRTGYRTSPLRGENHLAEVIEKTPGHCLVLDGADEWTKGAEQLAVQIEQGLERRQRGPLRLIVLGRPGDWTQAIRSALKQPIKYHLLPLRAADVEPMAAEFTGQPSDGLLQAVRDRQLQALAARPIGVKMLALLWHEDDDLPTSRLDIYKRGLELLVSHPRQGRVLDHRSVFTAAERIAWVSILTRRLEFGFRSGPDDSALGLAEILDHFPELSRPMLDEALSSALFTPVSENRWRFAHLSFAEYLAAQFATRKRVSAQHLQRLLLPDDTLIPEPLIGLATWLCGFRPDLAEALIQHEPMLLARQHADVPSKLRGQWLEHLAHAIHTQNARPWPDDLRALAGGREVDQIARRLVDHPATAWRAVLVAAWTKAPGIADWLATVALNKGTDLDAREMAARELGALPADTPHRARALDQLKTLANTTTPDGLLASALSTLWPGSILAIDVFDCLWGEHDTRSLLEQFLEEHTIELVDGLASAELPIQLLRLADAPLLRIDWSGQYGHPLRWPFESRLIQRAWDLAATESAVGEALGLLLAQYALKDMLRDLAVDFGWVDPARAFVISAAFRQARTQDEQLKLGWDTGLVPQKATALEQAEALAESEPAIAGAWLEFVWTHLHWPPADRDRCLKLAERLGVGERWHRRMKEPPSFIPTMSCVPQFLRNSLLSTRRPHPTPPGHDHPRRFPRHHARHQTHHPHCTHRRRKTLRSKMAARRPT